MAGTNPTKEENCKEIDLTQSTEWTLLCLSHQKNVLTFELENVKTKRVHKLIFSGAGTDEILQESVWTQGYYKTDFNTKFPANFDNFDGCLAMLTPSGPSTFTHTFRIGLLATIEINQAHYSGVGMWNLYGSCRIEYGSGVPKSKPNHYVNSPYTLTLSGS